MNEEDEEREASAVQMLTEAQRHALQTLCPASLGAALTQREKQWSVRKHCYSDFEMTVHIARACDI